MAGLTGAVSPARLWASCKQTLASRCSLLGPRTGTVVGMGEGSVNAAELKVIGKEGMADCLGWGQVSMP